MGNVVAINSKSEAKRVLNKYEDLVDQNDVRQTVHNALSTLNEVEERIDRIENKGFFRRMVGGLTGSNQREMVAAMRNLSEAQNMTIQLVLSLAIMHSQNQRALEDILDELDQSKGTYTRITDHIEFLYNQVENVKLSQRKTSKIISSTKNFIKYALIITGAAVAIYFVVGLFV